MTCLDVISCNTNGSENSKWKPTLNVEFWNGKKKCKLVDVNKYATNEPILEHTSMKA